MADTNFMNMDRAPRSPLVWDPSARTDMVQDGELLEISHDLFGAEEYGGTALSIIATERGKIAPYGIRRTVRGDRVILEAPVLSSHVDFPIEGSYMDTGIFDYDAPVDEAYEEKVLPRVVENLLAQTEFPFSNPGVSKEAGDDSRVWGVVAQHTSRDRLARFLDARGLSKGLLPGALGKAADILNVRAGLVPQDVVAEVWKQEPEYQYVGLREFMDAAKEAGISGHASRQTREAIGANLNQGLHEGSVGHAALDLDVVIDGDVKVSPTSYAQRDVVRFRNIATSSLQMLQDLLRAQGTQSKVQEFIAEYVAGVTE